MSQKILDKLVISNKERFSFNIDDNTVTLKVPEGIVRGEEIVKLTYNKTLKTDRVVFDITINGMDWRAFKPVPIDSNDDDDDDDDDDDYYESISIVYDDDQVIHYETKSTLDYSITFDILIEDNDDFIEIIDAETTLEVIDIDKAPTGIEVTALRTTINENESDVHLANIKINDDEFGENDLVALPEDSIFEYRNVTRDSAELWLKKDVKLDYETLNSKFFDANIALLDHNLRQSFRLEVKDVDEPAHLKSTPEMTVYEGVGYITVDEGLAYQADIATITGKDPEATDVRYYLYQNEDRQFFRIDSRTGKLTVNHEDGLNFETQSEFRITVSLRSSAEGNSRHREEVDVVIRLIDVLEHDERESLSTNQAVAGTIIGKVNFGGKDATYTVKEGGDDTKSNLFEVRNDKLVIRNDPLSEGTYTLTIDDGTGKSQTVTIKVFHNDTGDRITFTGNFTAREDTPSEDPSGRVTLAPNLLGYTLYFGETEITKNGIEVEGKYGKFTVNSDGTWSYKMNQGKVNYLDSGDKITETIDVTYKNGDNIITQTMSINISGQTDIYVSEDGEKINSTKYGLDYRDSSDNLTLHNDSDGTGWTDRIYIHGGSGNNTLIGGAGYDYIYGNAGNDILDGGARDDHLEGGPGNDIIMGGEGYDYTHLDYSSAKGDVKMDVSDDSTLWKQNSDDVWVSGTNRDQTFIYLRVWADLDGDGKGKDNFDPDDEYDYVTGIEKFRIYGGSGNDTLTVGVSGDHHVLYGNAGNDTLTGSAGNDSMFGHDGNDTLTGGEGDDVLSGNAGNDILNGGEGDDYAYLAYHFANFDLTLDVTDDSTLWKQNSDNVWVSDIDRDPDTDRDPTFIYQRVWVDLDGDGKGKNDFDSDDEYDYVTGIERFSISSGSGNDTLTSGAGNDTLDGNAGNDILTGGADRDELSGGSGNDIFVLGGIGDGLDTVIDFSFGKNSGYSHYHGTIAGGKDKIRVDTANGNEKDINALKTAADLTWTNNTNVSGDNTINDTIISRGSQEVMVLEDFTETLTIDMFDII